MIRSAIRWMRVVLPPAWALWTFVLMCAATEGFVRGSLWWLHHLGVDDPPSQEFMFLRDLVIGISLGSYGAYRAMGFHPVFWPEYRRWLEQTPWTSRQPLPVGPVHLVLQDFVIVLSVLPLFHSSLASAVAIACAFLVAYLVPLGTSLAITGPKGWAYAIAFGLGLAARLKEYPIAAFVVVLILYGLACLGLRQALARFPWEHVERSSATRAERAESRNGKSLGWPFDALQPTASTPGISYLDGVLVSLLAGWWIYVISIVVASQDQQGLYMFSTRMILGGCVLIRLGRYCLPYWPPISILGRLRTGQWIIPDYDRVLVAPLCTLAVGTVLLWGLPIVGLSPGQTALIAVPVILGITLNAGPTLHRWRLTGRHRVAPIPGNSQELLKL